MSIPILPKKGGGSWTIKTSTNSHFFETMSKRRKGFPSETKVKRGVRIVHGNKELDEKLGRNDLCPCGSGKPFKKCCLDSGSFRRSESASLLLGNDRTSPLGSESRAVFRSQEPSGSSTIMDATANANTSTELHPWVVLTQACLERAKPNGDGLIHSAKVRRLNVCVGKESIQRAMHIWDRILKAVEASRFKIRMEKESPCRTIVTVDGEELSIGIKEKLARKEHVPTAEEIGLAKRYTHLFQPPKWDLRPSGNLVLTIDRKSCDDRTRNELKWTDSEKKRIEDRLTSFGDVLSDVAKHIKESRARAEEWEREREEERRIEREARRVRIEEKRRFKKFTKQLAAWRMARSMRGFIQAVREEATRRPEAIEPGSALDQWIHWAERHAAAIDPVGSVLAGAGRAGKEG
ncbi:MAG: SEC-C domain-containing protein [Planctomycetota bacterium]